MTDELKERQRGLSTEDVNKSRREVDEVYKTYNNLKEKARLTDEEIKKEKKKSYSRGMIGFTEDEIETMVNQEGVRADDRNVAEAQLDKAIPIIAEEIFEEIEECKCRNDYFQEDSSVSLRAGDIQITQKWLQTLRAKWGIGNEGTKFCPKCKLEKNIDCFSLNITAKDGRQNHCKVCLGTESKNYYRTHREECRIAKQRRRAPSPVKCYWWSIVLS